MFEQEPGQCFFCNLEGDYRYHTYLQEHHIFFGTANRKISEKYGLKVYLCDAHHRANFTSKENAVHFNKKNNDRLRAVAQKAFEEKYSPELFWKLFQENWIWD
jgi:hypothetical protein